MTQPEWSRGALPRPLLVLLGTAAATITLAGMRASASILGPMVLALVVTIAVHPMRAWLVRRHLPGWAATIVMVVTVYSVLLAFVVAVVAATARFASLLPTYRAQMESTVQDATAWLLDLGFDEAQLRRLVETFDLGTLAAVAGNVLDGILGLASLLLLVVTLLLFLAVDGAWFPARLATTPQERRPLAEALDSFATGTRRYLLVSTVFGLIVACLDTGALWLMGIPTPLVWGLLAFMTNYIPNIGFVIGLVPPMILGLLEGGVPLMLAVLAVYCVLNVVIQSVIQPRVIGNAVGLSATLTFVSLVFWAWVLGAMGALLAIPLSLLVKALLVDIDPGTRWLGPLLDGTRDGPPGPARKANSSLETSRTA